MSNDPPRQLVRSRNQRGVGRPVAYMVGAIIGSVMATSLIPLGTKIVCYWIIGGITLRDSFSYVEQEWLGMLSTSSPSGPALLAVNYAAAFGIPIVLGMWLLARNVHPKRVLAMLTVAVAVMSASMISDQWEKSIGIAYMLSSKGLADAAPLYGRWWMQYTVQPSLFSLIFGLAAGFFISRLPLFRPNPAYWIRQGLCPKCHYSLRSNLDAGCPECGWNRADQK